MPDLGVHGVGKVERRRAERQVLDVAVRREHIHPLAERLARELADITLTIEQLPQHRDTLLQALIECSPFLVRPVCSDAELCVAVHVAGAHLHFHRAPAWPEHGGVQRAVAVFLGVGDVVVELTRDRRPGVVHDAEYRITLAHVIHQHPHRAHIKQLIELEPLAYHLSPNAVEVLRTARDLRIDEVRLREQPAQSHNEGVDVFLAIGAALFERAGHALVGFGFALAKREVFECPLELGHTEAVGERRVDIESLTRHAPQVADAGLLQALQQPELKHQFDKHGTHIVDGREKHPANGFRTITAARLRRLTRRFAKALHPADIAHQTGHGITEFQRHVGLRQTAPRRIGREQGGEPRVGVGRAHGYRRQWTDTTGQSGRLARIKNV